jgi:hypothetical protein
MVAGKKNNQNFSVGEIHEPVRLAIRTGQLEIERLVSNL